MSHMSIREKKTTEKTCYEGLIDYLLIDFWDGLFALPKDKKINYDQNKHDVEDEYDITCSSFPHRYGIEKIKKYKIIPKDGNAILEIFIVNAVVLNVLRYRKFREQILQGEKVQGIFTLKDSFFGRGTIPIGVIVIGDKCADSIWLTSAISTDDVIQIFTDISSYHRPVFYTTHLDAGNFMPDYYSGEKEQAEAALDKISGKGFVRLEDVADIILGKSAQQDDFGERGFFYIRPRDIQGDEIINPDIYVKEATAEKYAKQLLQEGDILVSKNFGQRKIAMVGLDNLPAMASSGLFIVRPSGISEKYLFQYLSSNTGRKIFDKQLNCIERGVYIRSINLKDFKDIKVPVFDEQTMMDFLRIEELNLEDAIRLFSNAREKQEKNDFKQFDSMIEKRVYDDLVVAGWDKQEIRIRGMALDLQSGKWEPDIVLLKGNTWIAAIEVMADFVSIESDWIRKVQEVVSGKKVPFLIISTGFYYEIHSTETSAVRKFTKPPSKEVLASLLNGKVVG